MNKLGLIMVGGSAIISASCTSEAAKETKKPNIIFILADDMGIGDLSCYGQTIIKTPNIDKLAASGKVFTQHYSGSTVSAPSRSTLMTGQHTGHTPIRGNKELKDREGQTPIPAETFTVAEMFKKANYTTGCFGKWGLGYIGSEGDAINQGFDEFFGYNCQRQAHRYYPTHLWHNDQKVILKGNDNNNMAVYAPDVIQEKTLDFIAANKDNPFFAYVAIVQPHAEMIAPDDEVLAMYKGKIDDISYVADKKGAEYGSEDFDYSQYCSQSHIHATYAAMVTRIDKYIGEIVAQLEKDGNLENTFILFSSDNGVHDAGGNDPEFFNSNAGFRGIKRDLSEGGIRTPMIMNWKGTIEPNTKSDMVSAFWDIMPTFAEIAGVTIENKIDGISILPEILGKEQKEQHDFLYWEFNAKGDKQAVRIGNWKAIREGLMKNPNAPIQLYDLSTDKKEEKNLAKKHPEIVKQALEIMEREHIENKLFPIGAERK